VIQTHDPSVRAVEEISCLRPRGHRDRQSPRCLMVFASSPRQYRLWGIHSPLSSRTWDHILRCVKLLTALSAADVGVYASPQHFYSGRTKSIFDVKTVHVSVVPIYSVDRIFELFFDFYMFKPRNFLGLILQPQGSRGLCEWENS
jgi:hypothetical protein